MFVANISLELAVGASDIGDAIMMMVINFIFDYAIIITLNFFFSINLGDRSRTAADRGDMKRRHKSEQNKVFSLVFYYYYKTVSVFNCFLIAGCDCMSKYVDNCNQSIDSA